MAAYHPPGLEHIVPKRLGYEMGGGRGLTIMRSRSACLETTAGAEGEEVAVRSLARRMRRPELGGGGGEGFAMAREATRW